MKLLIFIIYSFLIFFIISSVSAQNGSAKLNHQSDLYYENLTVDHGLSHSTVMDIIQDKQGFLWFSTRSGLNRYDGFTFRKYFSDPVDTNSLSGNSLQSVVIDNDGKIWIGSMNGLNVYDPLTDKVTQVSDLFNENDINERIEYAQKDKNGDLWFTSIDQSLFYYDFTEGSFTRYKLPHLVTLDSMTIRSLLVNSANNLLIGTTEGLFSIDIDSFKITGKIAIRQLIKDKFIWSMTEDGNNNLWIGTNKRVITFPDENIVKQVEVNLEKIISCLLISEDQKLWVGSNNGLYVYDLKKRKPPENFFTNRFVDKIFEDNSNVIWVAIRGEGLSKFSTERKQFPAPIVFNDQVTSVLEEENKNLWVGVGDMAIVNIDPVTKTRKNYRIKSPYSFPVFTINKNKNGKIFAGMLGVLEYSSETDSFIPLRIDYSISPGFSSGKVWDNFGYVFVFFDDGENMWIGCNRGLLKYEYETHRISRILNRSTGQSLFPNFVKEIYKDKYNNMWIGSHNGMFLFDPESEEIEHFIPDQNDPQSISGNYVTAIIDSKEEGMLWIATGNGLNKFNIKTRKFSNYTIEHGLSNNGILGLLYDEKGYLWMSTNNGISRFDPENETFKNYYKTDGLQDNVFLDAYFKNSDGKIYFGGSGGITAFYPDSIKDETKVPDVVITSFKIFNKEPRLDTAINYIEQITLLHNENVFSIEYAALNFTNPLRNQFAHKLAGFDKDWIFTGNKHDVTYTNLKPGKYTFLVKGTNHDGVWNEQATSLQITILPPLWATWWAYLIYAFTALGVFYLIRRYELNRLGFKHEMELKAAETSKLQEVDHLKSKFFANITHEFRTPLTVILGLADQLLSKTKEKITDGTEKSLEMIRRNGENLLRLVNQMLDLVKLESGNLELKPEQSDVIPYVKYLCESFQSLAMQKEINLTVYAEVDELVMDFDGEKLSIVISNLLSNAVKFTLPGGKIIAHINTVKKDEDEFLLVKIKDNGVGISEEESANIFKRFYQVDSSLTRMAEGAGIGLSLTKELVELMKGTISVQSSPGRGSEFSFEIPITRNAKLNKDIIPSLTLPSEMNGFNVKSGEISKAEQNDLPIVLLIEDNMDLVYYLEGCLAGKYQTIHAENGIAGIEKAYEIVPDIIICDVMMPGKDGFEVCSTLKGDVRTDHIPIIMLTAKVTMSDRLAGLSSGADAYLVKPFVKAELFTRLDQLMLLRQKIVRRIENGTLNQFLKKRVESPEVKFLQKAIRSIHQEMSSPAYDSASLAQNLMLSESQLYRKLKSITGKSTALFIRSIRLQKARELIHSTDEPISQVAYEVGFNDPSWFSRVFKEEFGFAPSDLTK